MMELKIFIIGHKRSGKDRAAERLRNATGMKFEASSMFCAKLFIFDTLKEKYGYTSAEEAFEDRHDHREEWFSLIADYNKDDPTRLSNEIFKENHAYVGLRRFEELELSKKRWPEAIVIYIDAEGRVPPESESSCTIKKSQAHIIIENKTTLQEYNNKLDKLVNLLRPLIK